MSRKFLAVFITILLLTGLGATSVVAAPPPVTVAGPAFSDIAGDPAEGELTIMAALGIMSGDAGLGSTVRPGATITRAEFSKMLVGAMGKSSVGAGLANQPPTFKDVKAIPQWAWGWVNAASGLGIVSGYPDGTFGPSNPVKYSEALAMLIRAVRGHDAQAKASPLPWPNNYVFYAVEHLFTADVVVYAELPATRGDVARLIFAMMQVDRANALGEALPATAYLTGRVFENTLMGSSGATATIGVVTKDLANPVYLVGATALAQMQALGVRGVTNAAGNFVVIQKRSASSGYTGILDTIDTTPGAEKLVFKGGRQIAYRPAVPVTLNNLAGLTQTTLLSGDECNVVIGPDTFAVTVNALRYDLGLDYLDSVTKSTTSPPADTRIFLRGGSEFNLLSACQVTINGGSAGRNDLAKNDVVLMASYGAMGATPIKVVGTRATAEGKVTGTTTEFPGPVWKVTIQKAGGVSQTYVMNPTYFAALPPNDTNVKYGLDQAGRIFVPIGFAATNPMVLVKGFSTSGTDRSVTVDERGATKVYPTTLDLSGRIGQYLHIFVNGSTGMVVDFTTAPIVGGVTYTVLSPAGSAGIVTIQQNPGGTVYAISSADTDVVAYSVAGSPATKTYIGITSVTAGMVLKADANRFVFEYTP